MGRTGGPAGNATLTAWTGLTLLLLLSLAELLTLVSLGHLLSWHIAIGAALVPVALLKIGNTGGRVVRYYRDNPHYKKAGPPPLLLRLLGPLVRRRDPRAARLRRRAGLPRRSTSAPSGRCRRSARSSGSPCRP